MTQSNLEPVFEALAQAIDAVGPDQSEVFLAKVALALVDQLRDEALSRNVIEECKTGLVG
jgi:hypothetical protein